MELLLIPNHSKSPLIEMHSMFELIQKSLFESTFLILKDFYIYQTTIILHECLWFLMFYKYSSFNVSGVQVIASSETLNFAKRSDNDCLV